MFSKEISKTCILGKKSSKDLTKKFRECGRGSHTADRSLIQVERPKSVQSSHVSDVLTYHYFMMLILTLRLPNQRFGEWSSRSWHVLFFDKMKYKRVLQCTENNARSVQRKFNTATRQCFNTSWVFDTSRPGFIGAAAVGVMPVQTPKRRTCWTWVSDTPQLFTAP